MKTNKKSKRNLTGGAFAKITPDRATELRTFIASLAPCTMSVDTAVDVLLGEALAARKEQGK